MSDADRYDATDDRGAGAGGTERAAERADTNESDALLERLAVIEQQPLESRADSFQQLHDELQRELDGGNTE